MTAATRLFVFGLGYSGGALARAVKGKAAWVGGTVRTLEQALKVEAGIAPFVFAGDSAGIGVAEAIRQASHVLVSIPPGDGDPALKWHRASIAAAPHLAWIGYFSTVGVYGDHGGAVVDEATPPTPASGRAVARLAAEVAWRRLAAERKVPAAVFRLAGIYGPGRNALANLAAGTAHRVVKPGQVFNRIHVDDIVATVMAAMDRRADGTFNVADDEPAPPQDVVTFAAGLMGVAPPPEIPFAEAELSAAARSFYGENRRVANRRIKDALGVKLRYPTYREGLTALWREGTWRAA
jgi:nucleoside-diphosphate-sugar epimerase